MAMLNDLGLKGDLGIGPELFLAPLSIVGDIFKAKAQEKAAKEQYKATKVAAKAQEQALQAEASGRESRYKFLGATLIFVGVLAFGGVMFYKAKQKRKR